MGKSSCGTGSASALSPARQARNGTWLDLRQIRLALRGVLEAGYLLFQAVGFFRAESCPTQAVLPLVGLAAEKVIRDRYTSCRR
ncbi:MAG: hypothetical protein R6U98_16415 [Pirellulaceae bacterium]